MIFVMMGPQACGKGTQGRMLSDALGIPLVTNGEILRNLPLDHPMKKIVTTQMNKGELVDQKFVSTIIKERIAQPDCQKGYILDGWMRKFVDMDFFYPALDYVIYVTLPIEESIRRISGRRVCELDGKTYNIHTMSPEESKYCEGHLVQREDDTEAAIKKRLDIFYDETLKVINHFRQKGKVLEVDGMGTPGEVFQRIKDQLIARGIPIQ